MDTLPHEKQIQEYKQTIDRLKKQNQDNPIFDTEVKRLEQKMEELKEEVYGKLTPWQRVLISRHHKRPQSSDYISFLFDNFHEIAGDRKIGDDPALIGGFATFNGEKCIVLGQEKGKDTESRVRRNFGMMHPEGFRKALRIMKLAEKFSLPVISFLDTQGAYPGLEAEERGQGWAIAENLREMASLETPIITLIIGEGCSGGALGIGMGDVVGMLEHSYYSVISPEGCASILWKDAAKKMEAASALKLNAEDLIQFQVIDAIIEEPLGGAHHDPEKVYSSVKTFLIEKFKMIKRIPIPLLLEQRYQKFRKMGQTEKVQYPPEKNKEPDFPKKAHQTS